MANNDKIYEAYHGSMGEKFSELVKERINYIVDNCKDTTTVIDAGCSQGIVSILLAEEGKKVVGIDIQPEAIEFATNILDDKHKSIKENIEFINLDFSKYKSEQVVDCVVASEVLEHLENPDIFLENIVSNLKSDGKVIITVPFGVSNHPDHYSTFYLTSIVKLVEKWFNIEKVDYIHNWIGIVANNKLGSINTFKLGKPNLVEEEENFLRINKELVERIEKLEEYSKSASEKYKRALENHATEKQWNNDLRKKIADLSKANNDLSICNKDLQEESAEYKKQLISYCEYIEEQVETLKEIKKYMAKLESRNAYLKHENTLYRAKISKITDTWYGELAIKMYRVLKKIKRKIKK